MKDKSKTKRKDSRRNGKKNKIKKVLTGKKCRKIVRWKDRKERQEQNDRKERRDRKKSKSLKQNTVSENTVSSKGVDNFATLSLQDDLHLSNLDKNVKAKYFPPTKIIVFILILYFPLKVNLLRLPSQNH